MIYILQDHQKDVIRAWDPDDSLGTSKPEPIFVIQIPHQQPSYIDIYWNSLEIGLHMGLLNQKRWGVPYCCFNKSARWFWCSPKFNNNWSKLLSITLQNNNYLRKVGKVVLIFLHFFFVMALCIIKLYSFVIYNMFSNENCPSYFWLIA